MTGEEKHLILRSQICISCPERTDFPVQEEYNDITITDRYVRVQLSLAVYVVFSLDNIIYEAINFTFICYI